MNAEVAPSNQLTSATMTQVAPVHYEFRTYVTWQRWSSYWHQMAEISAVAPQGVLYVGIGDNIVPTLLEKNGFAVERFDFDAALSPKYAGDVRAIDKIVPLNSVDVVACCQVLEHLPFEDFEPTIRALTRIARKRIVISLPVTDICLGHLKLNLPKLPKINLEWRIPRFWHEWQFTGEHYWEIGAKGRSLKTITRTIERCQSITRTYIARENAYHRFFILDK